MNTADKSSTSITRGYEQVIDNLIYQATRIINNHPEFVVANTVTEMVESLLNITSPEWQLLDDIVVQCAKDYNITVEEIIAKYQHRLAAYITLRMELR